MSLQTSEASCEERRNLSPVSGQSTNFGEMLLIARAVRRVIVHSSLIAHVEILRTVKHKFQGHFGRRTTLCKFTARAKEINNMNESHMGFISVSSCSLEGGEGCNLL